MEARVKAELDCPICLETFTKPIVILPCGHHLCEACVNQMPGGIDQNKTCPNCRGIFVIGEQGLPRNRILENVIDQLNTGNHNHDTITNLTRRVRELCQTTVKERKTKDEIAQFEELSKVYLDSNDFAYAKSLFYEYLYDLNGTERLVTMLKIMQCCIALNDMSETKNICSDIIATSSTVQLKPNKCDDVISIMKTFGKKLALKRENRMAMRLVRSAADLCKYYANAELKVLNLSCVAGGMEVIAESMGKSETFSQCISLLEDIRHKIKAINNADPAKRCVSEVWCLKYIGFCYNVVGEYNMSESVYKKALSRSSALDHPKSYNVFGHCYHGLGATYECMKSMSNPKIPTQNLLIYIAWPPIGKMTGRKSPASTFLPIV